MISLFRMLDSQSDVKSGTFYTITLSMLLWSCFLNSQVSDFCLGKMYMQDIRVLCTVCAWILLISKVEVQWLHCISKG